MKDIRSFLQEELKDIKSELSLESLVSIALHEISKNEYFKENYSHFDLIENNGEYRVLANRLNDISGIKNNYLDAEVLNPVANYETDTSFYYEEKKEEEEPENENDNDNEYDDDDYYYDYYEEEKVDIHGYKPLFSERKSNNIKRYLEILSTSNNFNEINTKIKEENHYMLLDVFQSMKFILNRVNNESSSLKKINNLLSNFLIYDIKEGHFKFKNKEMAFGSTYSRDYFNAHSLEHLCGRFKKEEIKNIINDSSLWSFSALFYDQNGKTPKEVVDIFKDDNIENWEAVRFFAKNNKDIYKNKLFNIAFVTNEQINKKELAFDYFFKKEKNKILKEIEVVKDIFIPKETIINKTKKEIEPVLNKVDKLYFNKNSIENIKVENYYLKEEDNNYNYLAPQVELLNDEKNNAFNFCGEKFIDSPVKGFSYCGHDMFKSVAKKDNILVVLRNENEIVAYGSLYPYQDEFLQVNIVNVAKHMRGKGLIQPIYKEFAKYAEEKNMPIVTTHYTDLGRQKIPEFKRELLENNKNILWLDNCSNPHQTEKESLLSDISGSIVSKFKTVKDQINLKEAREVYDKLVDEIDDEVFSKENEMNFSLKWETKEKFAEDFSKKIDDFILNKNKKDNKKQNRIKRKP